MTDRELLHEYLVYTSDSAFTDLVRRHIDLVYRICRRDTEDDRLALAATQDVFSMLAHKAGSIHDDSTIAEWLFERSRMMARNILVREMRDLPRAEHPTLERLLNDAFASLPTTDREALLLRICEERKLHEVAEEIGISEDIVKTHLTAALAGLRTFLDKRGAPTQASTLEAFLKEDATQTAPVSANTVAETALGTKHPAAVDPVPAPSTAPTTTVARPRKRPVGPIIAAVATVVIISVAGLWMLTLTPSGAPAKLQPPPMGPAPSQIPAAAGSANNGTPAVAGTNDPFAAQPDTAPAQAAPATTPSTPQSTSPRKPAPASAPDVATTPDGLIPGPKTAPAPSPNPPTPSTTAPAERVLGIVTGQQPNAVIVEDNRERIVVPGDTVDSGTVQSIAKDHITITAPDGRLITLPVTSTGR
jgi:RNA polymerase sigma factor (sigma-70 family)